MKKSLLFILLVIPSICNAKALTNEYAVNLNNYYGYTDYSSPYKGLYKENNINASINLYGKTSYRFDEDYSVSVVGYIMADSNKEVENYNQGKWGEEFYASLESPIGEFSFGQLQNVAYGFAVGAPNVGSYRVNNTDLVNFINNPNWYKKSNKTSYKTLNSTYLNTDGASVKINYITPDYNGLMLGVSYIPDVYSQSGLVSKKAEYKNSDGYVIGAYGLWDVLGYEVETSLGFAEYEDIDNEYSAGISFYRKGFTLGASYRKTKSKDNKYAINQYTLYDAYRDGDAYNVGVSYAIGPFTTGISYFDSKSNVSKNRDKIVSFSNSYDYNKNTTFSFIVAHLESVGENHDNINNSKGYAFILGLELNL